MPAWSAPEARRLLGRVYAYLLRLKESEKGRDAQDVAREMPARE